MVRKELAPGPLGNSSRQQTGAGSLPERTRCEPAGRGENVSGNNTETKLMVVRQWAAQERKILDDTKETGERLTRLEMIEFLLRVLDKGEG